MDWEESIPTHKPFSAASTDGSGIEIDELDIGDIVWARYMPDDKSMQKKEKMVSRPSTVCILFL